MSRPPTPLRTAAALLGVALLTAGMAGPAGAQAPEIRWDWTPESIRQVGQQTIEQADREYDRIARMPDGKRTFANTALALSRVGDDAEANLNAALFLKYVSTDAAIRDAGDSLETEVSRWAIATQSREDLYKALKAALAKDPPQTDIDKRLAQKMLLDYELAGLGLPKEKRDRVVELKQQISDIGIAFDTNLNSVQDSLVLSRDELAGMPDSYIERLDKTADGRYKVTVSYPDFYPFMQNSTNAAARRALEEKFSNRAAEANLPLLAEALKLRQELAETMGYPNYAAYATVDRMAKNPANVMSFLDGLVARLRPYRDQDLATLNALKARTEGASAGPVEIADWRYYDNLLKKTEYQIDPEEVRQYFPLDVVTTGLLDTYQKLFSLKFTEVKPANAWHEDVQLFRVTDAGDGHLVGFFYLDLFPRPNKFGHAAAWGLAKHMELASGRWKIPISAMVCNFTKPTAADPSLLNHDEVETFFHEFGHVMHNMLSQEPYGYFAGTSVYRDFVEAPSQMLENWVWNADVLQGLSGHYKDHSKKLPRDLLDRMIAAKNLDNGLKYSRQAFFALSDMRYHMEPTVNTTEVWHDGMKNIFGIAAAPGTHEEASFGHLFGYEAGYYSYLWSEVYAADMFSRFEKEGVMNPATGLAYRNTILAPGGSREPMDMMRDFLGREPNDQAFLRHIGLKTAATEAPAGAPGSAGGVGASGAN